MGLDAVDLLLQIEESFSITIDDEEASRIRTVGDLHNLVVSKLRPASSRQCLTSHVFYRLRSTIGGEFGVQRQIIDPCIETDSLIPIKRRREAWRVLSRRLTWGLPGLRRPGWLVGSFYIGFIVAISFAIIAGNIGILSVPVAWALGLLTIAGCWIGYMVTIPFAVHVPDNSRTIAELVQSTLQLNFRRIAEDRQAWNERDVWQVVQAIVVDELGVLPSNVTADARFVEDLGID